MIKLKPCFHMIATIAVIAEKKKKKLQRSQRSYETTLQRSQRQQSLRYKKFYPGTHSSKLGLLLVLNPNCYCTRWFAFNGYPAGVLPYMANAGYASGQSIVRVQDLRLDRARHTRYKRAIFKRHLISSNRNIHPPSFE